MPPEQLPGFPVTIERGVPARMRDGVTLYADVYRPDDGDAHPVLLIRLPYDKTQAESTVAYAHPSWYASHGYMVVAQDCRGRFSSEGTFVPFEDEAADGYDTVEWAAALPGSSGHVAMFGFSYPGATQLLAAAQQPPSLTTICPAFTASQFYEGWTYKGGALSLAFAASWATYLAFNSARRRGDAAALGALAAAFPASPNWYWILPLDIYPPLTGPDAPYFFEWLAHPSYDGYWQRWSIDENYGRITKPALHVGGWYDIFLSGTVRNFNGLRDGAGTEAARRGQKLIIGPWYHMPWTPLAGAEEGAGASVVDDWQLRWFDHFLKGEDTGVLDAPVTVYILGRGWTDLDAWPPSQTNAQAWYLHSGGRANSLSGDGVLSLDAPNEEPPDVFVYDPEVPTLSQGGHSCCVPIVAPTGPADQWPIESTRTVLCYTSGPLERELILLGDARVSLHAASTAVDTDFTARLCQVDEAGRSTNLQEGIVRARYRDSLREPAPITPGEVYEYRIELGPVGTVVPPGYRLRLTVASSDFPQWDRNLNTGGKPAGEDLLAAVVATQTVFHDGVRASHVVLPIFSPR